MQPINTAKNKGKAYLVFSKQRKVEKNLKRLSISSHYNKLRDTPIKGLGSWNLSVDNKTILQLKFKEHILDMQGT